MAQRTDRVIYRCAGTPQAANAAAKTLAVHC